MFGAEVFNIRSYVAPEMFKSIILGERRIRDSTNTACSPSTRQRFRGSSPLGALLERFGSARRPLTLTPAGAIM